MNVGALDFEYDPDDPEGFRAGRARLGPGLGAERTGASAYELPPGEADGPYHYELVEEEWLLVLAGRPTLRRPGGEEELAPGDVAFFPRGRTGAHRMHNPTGETVRVIMFSDLPGTKVAVYPDSGKVGVFPGGDEESLIVPRESGVDYFAGESGA